MDISSLQVPRAGRSRFSKALPTPPPGSDDLPQTALRELPNVPPAPLPPKKNSILLTKLSLPSLRSKALDSPLPALPIMAEPARPRLQAGPIARKPVAKLPTPPATTGDTKSKAMKRKSSISSLLSAYSRSSSDWGASHESDFTKDSEPSYSPEREGMGSLPPVPSKKSMETTNDVSSDRTSEVTSYTIIDSFPPPPPLKDPSRPRTPSTHTPSTRTVGPVDGARDRTQDREGEGDSASLSPVSVRSGSSRAGPHEIWRRRASSKSDGSLVIAELKLPGSNGSTASTSHIPARNAEPPSVKPPLPAKTNHQPALPLPLPPKPQQQSAAILPPRTVSLPGRNIRPIKQTKPVDEDDEMKKLMKLSKLKELVRGRGGDDSDGEQKKGEELELQETKKPADVNTDANKPEPPAKDNPMQQPPQPRQGNAPTAAAGEANVSAASPSDTAAPQQQSGVSTAAGIARRPVGAQLASNQNLAQAPRLELEFEKKTTSLPSIQELSIETESTSRPRNPSGTLPFPNQHQQQQPYRGLPAHPYPRSGPTSPTGGPRSVSTSAHPSQSQSAAMAMTGLHRPPGTIGTINTGSPRYQSHTSQPVSPGTGRSPAKGSFSSHQFMSPPRPPNPPFAAQSSTFGSERGTTAQGSGRGVDVYEDRDANAQPEQPMSDAAATAVSLFPRNRQWNLACTVDGVWPANPLGDRHYDCHLNHNKFINSRNTHYPLTCQTCGIADKERRYMCTYCNLRICVPCVELLTANRRDLRATMEILREQGKIKDWDDYPKRDANQDTEDTQDPQADAPTS
ncbi:hypothetical protein F4803DRAFT_79781 [Xylaria telfairii]|nr:hypothetical protein F4803DRAFT_79781 [Xylaria telfairii]